MSAFSPDPDPDPERLVLSWLKRLVCLYFCIRLLLFRSQRTVNSGWGLPAGPVG